MTILAYIAFFIGFAFTVLGLDGAIKSKDPIMVFVSWILGSAGATAILWSLLYLIPRAFGCL